MPDFAARARGRISQTDSMCCTFVQKFSADFAAIAADAARLSFLSPRQNRWQGTPISGREIGSLRRATESKYRVRATKSSREDQSW